MKEKQSTTIDGDVYAVQMLPATRSWKLLLKLSKIVGPALGQIVDAAKGGNLMEQDISDPFFAEAVRSLMANMEEAKVETIMNELKTMTEVDRGGSGKFVPLGDVFELHFQGKMANMVKWLAFALRSQYSDFFAELRNASAITESLPQVVAVNE